jgi:2,4-dienoyl-CoA reductase-like NADH-dependent reductase (Old Yellow Enzyme family)
MEKASTMTIEDIQDTIAQFAASAKSAKDLGSTVLKFMEHMAILLISFSGK